MPEHPSSTPPVTEPTAHISDETVAQFELEYLIALYPDRHDFAGSAPGSWHFEAYRRALASVLKPVLMRLTLAEEQRDASDALTLVRAFTLAADLIAGHKRSAAVINLFGEMRDAYGAAERECRELARKVERGEEIKDNNGLVWRAKGKPHA